MAKNHYEHLMPIINSFFTTKNMNVVIEPCGSRGPDIEGINGTIAVGEIKSKMEIARDLKGYWSQWNSEQSFGGKTKDYKLRSEFPSDVENLDSAEKGWLAVIYGQLRYYCRNAGQTKGWLVIEDYEQFSKDLKSAVSYLQKTGKCTLKSADTNNGVGFLLISF